MANGFLSGRDTRPTVLTVLMLAFNYHLLNRKGIPLHYLREAIKSACSLIPKNDYPNADSTIALILLQFTQAKSPRVFVARNFLGNIQEDYAFGGFSETLSNFLAVHKWVGPTFKGKPVNATVVYDRSANGLRFVP